MISSITVSINARFLLVLLAICLGSSRVAGKVTIYPYNIPSKEFITPIYHCQEIASAAWPSFVETKVLLQFKSYDNPDVLGRSAPIGWESLNTSVGQQLVPSAVAKAVTSEDMRPNEYDLAVSLNQDANWYTGASTSVPSDKVDLISVCLHEVYHGLLLYGKTTPGSVDVSNRLTQFIAAETPGGDCSILSYKNYPSLLMRALTGNGVWFRTAERRVARLYAPDEWIQGSSLYHIDDFNGISFMTPYTAYGVRTRTISPAVLAIQNVMLNISEVPPKLCGHETKYEPIAVSPQQRRAAESVIYRYDFWLVLIVFGIALRGHNRLRF